MSPFWHDILVPGIPLLEKVVRLILVYICVLIGLRLAGKRELAQLNNFDLVVLLLLSNTVQNAIIGNDNSVVGGLVGAAALLLINHAVVVLAFRSQRFSEIVEGGPDILIEHGRLNQVRLAAEKITVEELGVAARKQGFPGIEAVDSAILYPGGTFCFIGKVPGADAIHHHQIMKELRELKLEVARLRPSDRPTA